MSKSLSKTLEDEVFTFRDTIRYNEPEEVERIEVLVEANLKKEIQEITLVLGFSNPRVEFNIGERHVIGTWGNKRYISAKIEKDVCENYWEYYKKLWEKGKEGGGEV